MIINNVPIYVKIILVILNLTIDWTDVVPYNFFKEQSYLIKFVLWQIVSLSNYASMLQFRKHLLTFAELAYLFNIIFNRS